MNKLGPTSRLALLAALALATALPVRAAVPASAALDVPAAAFGPASHSERGSARDSAAISLHAAATPGPLSPLAHLPVPLQQPTPAEAPQQPPAPTDAAPAPQQSAVPTAVPSATRPPTAPPTETPGVVRTATLSASAVASTATSEAVSTPEKSIPREERPIVHVEGFQVDPGQPAAGGTFRLTLQVANVGERFAENIEITLSSETFFATEQGSVLYVNDLKAREDESVDVVLRVAANATAGTHPLNLALRWDDSYGGSYSDQASIGIETGGAGAQRPLVVVTGSRLPGRVAPGIAFNLGLELLNTGAREARNLITSPTTGPLTLQGTGMSGPVSIPAGGRLSVTLRVQASNVAEPGAASQTLELRYEDADGQRYTETQAIGVIVTGDAAIGPMPMIESYTVDPAELHPGSVFDLILNLQNSGVADALTTRLAIGGGGGTGGSGGTGAASSPSLGVFAPLETSNVRFLDRLKAGELRSVTQKMVVDGAAKPGVYTLNIGFNFVDADGQALQTSEVVSLLVSREVNLTLTPQGLVTSTLVGEPIALNVELVNAGNATVNVTNVEVDGGPFFDVAEGAARFIGALDAGASDTIEASLTPKGPGKAQASVIVHYTDDFNRLRTVEKAFNFEVEEAPPMPPEDLTREQPKDAGLFVRALKGFFGLGASPAMNLEPAESIEIVPMENSGGSSGSSGSGGGGMAPARPAGGAVRIQRAP